MRAGWDRERGLRRVSMEHGRRSGAWRRVLPPVCLVLALLVPAFTPPASAAPEWMSAETAATLDLGFDVLVPAWIPAPFEGEPRVLAGGGYYELYWVNDGVPPTFLEITGTVGGDIPDYSKNDRNNPLVMNASVQGYEAYHDVTPNYDEVWWAVGDVVYSVESRGMTGTDTLSLANALQLLEPSSGGTVEPTVGVEATIGVPEAMGSGEVASIAVEGAEGATLTADAGTFEDTGGPTYLGAGGFAVDWRAPRVEEDLLVQFVLSDPGTGAVLATAQTTVLGVPPAPEPETPAPVTEPAPEPEPQFSLSCPIGVTAGEAVALTVYGAGEVGIDASAGTFPAETPNTDLAPSAAGGARLYGTIPADGVASLVWIAPDVGEALVATISATGASGGGAACEIVVEPALAAEATEPVPPTEPVEPAVEPTPVPPEPTGTVDLSTGLAAPEPTPAETDPVAGPTAVPGTGEDSEALPNDPPSTVAPTSTAAVTPSRRTGTTEARSEYPSSDGSGGPSEPNYIGEPGLGTLKGRSVRSGALDGSQPVASVTATVAAPSLPAVPATAMATATPPRTPVVTPAPPVPSATPSPAA